MHEYVQYYVQIEVIVGDLSRNQEVRFKFTQGVSSRLSGSFVVDNRTRPVVPCLRTLTSSKSMYNQQYR